MLPLPADAQDHACFRVAMASSPGGMALLDADGTVLDANPALCRMFGCDADWLRGRREAALAHPDEAERAAAWLARVAAGAPAGEGIDRRCLRADGREVPVRFSAALLPDGRLLAHYLDLSAERALGELGERFEARVRERTAELQAAHARLEAFAYGVSHDLRAPVRAIDGFAVQLARHAGDALDPQAREQLARIRNASARMGGLIDSLLELARIGRAPLRPAPVDVSLLAEWALAELQEAQPERAARLHVQPGLEAFGDERLLKLLMTQLLRNAWRFSAPREQVEIEVSGARTGEGLQFVVRDRGIGFDMAYAGKLFEPFQRLHSGAQGAGDGIGLTIAQQIAARHRGCIRAESAPDAGASFHVELRDLPAAPEAGSQVLAEAGTG